MQARLSFSLIRASASSLLVSSSFVSIMIGLSGCSTVVGLEIAMVWLKFCMMVGYIKFTVSWRREGLIIAVFETTEAMIRCFGIDLGGGMLTLWLGQL